MQVTLPNISINEDSKYLDEVKNFNLKGSNTSSDFSTSFKEFKTTHKQAIVVLSDESQWLVKTTAKKALDELFSGWKVGDDIRLKDISIVPGSRKKGDCILKNRRDGSALFATSLRKCDDLSKALFLEKVDKTGYGIVTSDGKIWSVGYLDAIKVQYWKPGDRVVINKSNHGNRYMDYAIFNLTRNNSCSWITEIFKGLILKDDEKAA